MLTDRQRATLRTVCDTVVPSLPRDDDPDGWWGRKASDVGADEALATTIAGMAPEQAAGLAELLDALADQGFDGMSQRSREQVFTNLSLASTEAAFGLAALIGLTQMLVYAGVDPLTGRNPAWDTFGYPGPLSAPPEVPPTLATLVPREDTTLEADAVIVGSGAGGGVMAARLAEAGRRVVVLEMGGHYTEADYNQLELWAWQHLYWRGGPVPTADMNVTLQAGSCLGGGTEVNWTNCLRPKDWVRSEWANEHGLTDVATDSFDRHLDAIWDRLGVNDRCSELNGPTEAMRRAAERLGWSFAVVHRNWDETRHDPAMAGYLGFGDQSGAKRSTRRTFLQDAASHGARFLVGCFAERVLIEGGRAAGVEAVWTDPESGRRARVTVRAPQVVVAAGALESPALLLRSQIGGPAVGHNLRLHPCTATVGDYGEDMRSWWGPPHSGLVDEFAGLEGGYGFLIEGVQYTTGLGASAMPFTTAAEHKALLRDYRDFGTFIGLVRDRGAGRVTVDADGMAVPAYAVTDPRDRRMTARALEQQIRAHVAAGARRVFTMGQGAPAWRVGDDLDAYIARVQRIPPRAGGLRLFSAHQMGTCRLGRDPVTSVADPRGELHDTPGVWIGDASAFPTPSGTNPMITIMALASRTAGHVLEADAAARAVTATQELPA